MSAEIVLLQAVFCLLFFVDCFILFLRIRIFSFFFRQINQVKRQHDDAIKEINQAMTVRIKASKDLKRLTEERNAAMQV